MAEEADQESDQRKDYFPRMIWHVSFLTREGIKINYEATNSIVASPYIVPTVARITEEP